MEGLATSDNDSLNRGAGAARAKQGQKFVAVGAESRYLAFTATDRDNLLFPRYFAIFVIFRVRSRFRLLLNRSPINYQVTLVFGASRVLRRPKLNPNPSL